jgi:UDP-3-O-[3-hydroxymyristoyl] glucosamine N-acyltransferase
MEFSAKQIADILEGKIVGNADAAVNRLSKIEEGEPGSLTFLANPKYIEFIYSTKASVAIVGQDFESTRELPSTLTLIKVKDAYQSFAQLLEYYNHLKNDKTGIEEPVKVCEGASIGTGVYLGAFSYIGKNTRIGDDTKIYPNVFIGDDVTIGRGVIIYAGCKIYSDTIIGDNCVIHAGAVLGADGFGFAPNQENEYNKVAQIGNVVIEDFVEIGANTCIDRATLGSTIIRKGTKLDNLIQIAHNCEVGEHTVIAAQTGIAGSTKIGKNIMIGGQVGIVGHLTIANDVKIAAQSGIAGSVKKEGQILQGSPAIEAGKYQRSYVAFRRLPELMNKLSELEKEITSLKNQLK